VENANQVVNFINNRFTERYLDRGYLLGHASAIAFGGEAVVIAARSGMGKSTLALHVMGLGSSYISNDRVLVKREAGEHAVVGVPKLPRVNPGTLLHNPRLVSLLDAGERSRLEALSPDELWTLEEKHDVFIGQIFGPGRYRLRANLRAIVVLDWMRNSDDLRVAPIRLDRRPDLLGAFMKSPGVFHRPKPGAPAERDEASYLLELEDVPAFAASGGVDFEQMAGVVKSLATTGSAAGGARSRRATG
jgi:HprK-related kinase B